MTSEQRYWWRIALELKLRKCSGDAFQDFFSVMMGKVHGTDFVRVRAYGRRGDKGCDGYVQSSGQVFQCYGALNGDSGKVDYLIGKMEDDYQKAVVAIPSLMKEWHMVHNIVDGLPIEAVEKLDVIKKSDPARHFGFIGIEGFEQRIFGLMESDIEDLLGVVATAKDAQNVQATEIRELVAHIASSSDTVDFDSANIKPVPPNKLVFNKLPNHWRNFIAGGWPNAGVVKSYLDRHPDPLMGERVAQIFRVRYQYLKAQNLNPGAIMSSLFEMVTGTGSVLPERMVAAQALLSFLFESCDIFEDEPAKVAS
ncbi:ABC-three component system protein [Archangium violaceum]|uniref:ABC-three component systems C-terminal domain-containing protein n=1 Tax=Archangium violaceum Cb vi76 TaxID=1406225 RepID=A0A084SK85_9BACT|nr:ABC-three component system protein [Archangium violaceum]KFA88870.1 hypothetical protein Q664_38855 [Archangium violaceum Cb vi76]